MFQDLTPQVGAGAIPSVGTLLERLNALESGKDRKATHKADLAAIEKLAARGYDAKLRAHLADLIKVATNQSKSEALSPVSEKEKAEKAKKADQSRSEQREAKIALWRLLDEWSEIARLQITRRDYLIYLGLAKRKKKGKAAPEGGGEPGGDK